MISSSTVDVYVLWQEHEPTGTTNETQTCCAQDPSHMRRSISPGLACTGWLPGPRRLSHRPALMCFFANSLDLVSVWVLFLSGLGEASSLCFQGI